MAPDADYVLRLISDTAYLQYHRGVTHSILMLPLWAWLSLSLFRRSRRKHPLLPWLIALVIACHIVFDLITSFGTMIFAPLSDARLAWDLVFIIDPLFSATLAIPLAAGLWLQQRQRMCAAIALTGMGLYLLLTVYSHQQALEMTRARFPAAEAVHALPLPFSPFHWQLIASFPDHYQRAAVDMLPGFPGSSIVFTPSFAAPYLAPLREPARLQWQLLPSMQRLPGVDDLPEVVFYRWFARFPAIMREDASGLEIGDLRFGAGLWPADPFRLHIDYKPVPSSRLEWNVIAKP